MSTVNDGGPAFPMTVEDDRDCAGRFASGYGGMTLRDYFAAKALVSLAFAGCDNRHAKAVAADCYMFADAMLAARANGGGKGAV